MVGAGGEETQPLPAAAGSDVFVFDIIVQNMFLKNSAPISDPIIPLRPADVLYKLFSRGRALDFLRTHIFRLAGLWIVFTQTFHLAGLWILSTQTSHGL